ncbi:hypothetical protein GCM10009557_16490 [Virgisporangium ochraceum]|uniref:Uncharacterized protein n=1 Tax=Virgisporangium ochraceum TaxID=65505 RepID=A0A8J4A5K4_9ACTN|nr:hypothetical protein [Virgisporangium ochraceum]GIJ73206.1 hypothetical protein Voc01_081230 [Virgisporangium ochraceum]
MTDPLVSPDLLAALPYPWRLTGLLERGDATRALPPTPHERTVAVSALETSLAHAMEVRARYGHDPDWGLPPQFFDDYYFPLLNTLHRSMPTLADVSRPSIRDWAHNNVNPKTMFRAEWTTPPDDFIDSVGRMWVSSTIIGACEHLIRWLRQVARDHLTDDQRTRVVDLLKEATPRLQWRLAVVTIPAILDLGGPQQRAYFDQLANDPNVHENTREEAASVRRLIDRQNPPS